jgi:hypothetical protein
MHLSLCIRLSGNTDVRRSAHPSSADAFQAQHGEKELLDSGRRGEGEQKKNGNGIGLGNTAERLKTHYGTDFEFSLAWPEAGGCEVVLEVPLRRARNLQETSSCAF